MVQLENGASWAAATWTEGPEGRASGSERVKASIALLSTIISQPSTLRTAASEPAREYFRSSLPFGPLRALSLSKRNCLVRPFVRHAHFAALPGSGMDIPPIMRQSFPLRSQACVMRRVCAAPFPSLSTHLNVIQ